MPSFGVPTDLPTILTALQTALTTAPFAVPATNAPFDPSQIIVTLAPESELEKFFTKDQCLIVRPKANPINRPEQAGGGRAWSGAPAMGGVVASGGVPIDGSLEFNFYTRFWVQSISQDEAQVSNAQFGLAPAWAAIGSLLEQWVPLDPLGSGNSILKQPGRFEYFNVIGYKGPRPDRFRFDGKLLIPWVQAFPTFS